MAEQLKDGRTCIEGNGRRSNAHRRPELNNKINIYNMVTRQRPKGEEGEAATKKKFGQENVGRMGKQRPREDALALAAC